MDEFQSIDWKEESNHIIQDVKDLVHIIQVSDQQPDEKCIYLNIITKERKDYTVKLCDKGFCVVSRKINSPKSSTEGEVVWFETPYSLLASISHSYHESFGNQLRQKLEELKTNPVYGGRE